LVQRLLAKNPQERFPTAQRFLEALERVAPAKLGKERAE
jgi:hypothetical protein